MTTTLTIKVANIELPNGNRAVKRDAALEELAASIKQDGLIEPIVLRELPGGVLRLVVGRRRVEALKLAGITEVGPDWAHVRIMTDQEEERIRLAENLHREDLHPMDELGGYERLLALGEDVAGIARTLGKSVEYVTRRLALRALSDKARTAFRAGRLTYEIAHLIARLPTPKDRDKVLSTIESWQREERGRPPVARHVQDWIAREILLRLDRVPWKLDDETLVPAAGPCTTCPKRGANQRVLWGKDVTDDTCLDRECFASKQAAHLKRQVAAVKQEGQSVLSAEGAEKKAKEALKAKQLPGGSPVLLDGLDGHDYSGRTYQKRLGAEYDKQCRGGCKDFAFVLVDGALHPACFNEPNLKRLLGQRREAEREAPERRSGTNGGAGVPPPNRAKRATSIAGQVRGHLDRWLIDKVTPALGKSLAMERKLLLLVACLQWKSYPEERQQLVRRLKFDPTTIWDTGKKWEAIQKMPDKRVLEILHALVVEMAPGWGAQILHEVARTVGVDPAKQLVLTPAMLNVHHTGELLKVAKELGLKVDEGGKKSEIVAALAKQMKAGRLPAAWRRVVTGKGE